MFQTQASLKKKALNGNINREEYISLLASEFYSTRNVGKNIITSNVVVDGMKCRCNALHKKPST